MKVQNTRDIPSLKLDILFVSGVTFNGHRFCSEAWIRHRHWLNFFYLACKYYFYKFKAMMNAKTKPLSDVFNTSVENYGTSQYVSDSENIGQKIAPLSWLSHKLQKLARDCTRKTAEIFNIWTKPCVCCTQTLPLGSTCASDFEKQCEENQGSLAAFSSCNCVFPIVSFKDRPRCFPRANTCWRPESSLEECQHFSGNH